MNTFFPSVFALLSTPTGGLAYHLVLAFAVAGALQAAFNHWRITDFPQGRRMFDGLLLLLVLRLGLFVASGLAWQGVIEGSLYLPPLDRAVNLLSLLVILWLWAFPEPARLADSAILLLSLLTLTFLALGVVWWSEQAPGQAFNSSLPDVVVDGFSLFLIAAGSFLLLRRRPNGWEYGFGMLLVLAAGHAANLLFPPAGGDYSGVVRLSQMAVYPLLLALPQRFEALTLAARAVDSFSSSVMGPPRLDSALLADLLSLASETDQGAVCRALAALVARAVNADICLIAAPLEDGKAGDAGAARAQGKFIFRCGYDLAHERELPSLEVDSRGFPTLAASLQRGRPLRLHASSTSPDLNNLERILLVGQHGHLLSVPVPHPGGGAPPLMSLVVLSPYSNRVWNNQDQAILSALAGSLAQFLHQNQQMAVLKEQLSSTSQALEISRREVEQVRNERQHILEELAEQRKEAAGSLPEAAGLAAILAAHEEAQETIARLEHENETLRSASKHLPGASPEELNHMEAELRKSLQEIAYLRSSLSEADQKIMALTRAMPQSLAENQTQGIAALAQELRQPLSSILGYTDFLLAESIGILGAKQRQFLERIRVSTERVGHLLDELIQVTFSGDRQPHVQEDIDLSSAIDTAIARTSSQLREKNIILRIDLPEQLPNLRVDSDALQQALISLLRNAGSVSPVDGDISLRARLESGDGEQEYVLVQVSDQGGGIYQKDMPRIFSHVAQAGQAAIPGVSSSGVDLATVKNLVESIGGRIWVDSQSGRGATFSVLIPVPFEAAGASSNHKNGSASKVG